MLPASASLCEVGPRDGFQFETVPIPTDLKLATIRALAAAGVPRIQATSFVHPAKVPQMADAAEIVAALSDDHSGAAFSVLALNLRGVERALGAGARLVDLSMATNERHAADNVRMTVEEGVAASAAMLARCHAAGVPAQVGLQTVWGYAAPGDTPLAHVVELARRFAGEGAESLSLADSTGLATPLTIRETVGAVQDALADVAPGTEIVLHLHDTRGAGLANVVAALELGVTRFDTSLGGLGGCPFIPGATGNIATEDTAALLEAMGVSTGLDIAVIAAATRAVAAHVGRTLPGKLYTLV